MQHSQMFAVGEKGSLFSIESMRKDAKRRLEQEGWTTIIHMHDVTKDCNDKCEYYPPNKLDGVEVLDTGDYL